MVRGDSERIEQVLLNLLLNAINYAPGTDRIDVELKSLDKEAEISIRDFGPGIKPQELELIFEQFSQGEPVVRPGTGGLGLGLFISREIVREHNGRISVDSTYGRGATFTVRLPLVDEPFMSPAASRSTDDSPGAA
jgi:two-component system CheB/CheR fusion protein